MTGLHLQLGVVELLLVVAAAAVVVVAGIFRTAQKHTTINLFSEECGSSHQVIILQLMDITIMMYFSLHDKCSQFYFVNICNL